MIDLARAKAHLKIEVDDVEEDALVQAYLDGAVSHVETTTGHLLSPQTVVQRVAAPQVGGAIRLFRSPVTAVTSISMIGSDGVEVALGDYRLIEGPDATVLPAIGADWPNVAAGHPAAMKISYTAGYAAGEAPAALEQAVLLLLGHFHRNREAVVTGTIATAVPMSVDALIAPYRAIGIA